MHFSNIRRLSLRLIIAGSVVWSCFCCIAGALAWLAVTYSPNQGDDAGLGILCIGFPLSLVCAAIILFAFEREFITPRGYFSEFKGDGEP